MQLKDWKLSSLYPLQKNRFLLFVSTYVFNMYPLIWQFQLQCVLWELDALQCVIHSTCEKSPFFLSPFDYEFCSYFCIFDKICCIEALYRTHTIPELFSFCVLLHFNAFSPVCVPNNEIANVAWMMSTQWKNSHVIL